MQLQALWGLRRVSVIVQRGAGAQDRVRGIKGREPFMTPGLHLLQLFSYTFNNNRIVQSIKREFLAVRLVPTETQANKLEHHCLVVTEPHRRGKHRRAIMEEVGG